jgi:hypothetical protein
VTLNERLQLLELGRLIDEACTRAIRRALREVPDAGRAAPSTESARRVLEQVEALREAEVLSVS